METYTLHAFTEKDGIESREYKEIHNVPEDRFIDVLEKLGRQLGIPEKGVNNVLSNTLVHYSGYSWNDGYNTNGIGFIKEFRKGNRL